MEVDGRARSSIGRLQMGGRQQKEDAKTRRMGLPRRLWLAGRSCPDACLL